MFGPRRIEEPAYDVGVSGLEGWQGLGELAALCRSVLDGHAEKDTPDARVAYALRVPDINVPLTQRPRESLLGWRLLALFYDLWPALALWMLLGTGFVIAFTIAGHATRENIAPFSGWQWALWAACWGLTGAYATVSWRRGGQTLGMRPWRLRLVAADDAPTPTWAALWIRYAVGTVSLLAGGLGFWWTLWDRDGLGWHDRASGTRLRRTAQPGRGHR